METKRDKCRRDITHEQPIGKQISYRPYKRIASFNGYFYKEDFLDWLLDLEDLFDYENICDERKVELALYKLREYVLRWWEQMQFDRLIQGKNKIHSWPRMKKMLAIRFYPLDCDELLSYTKQYYYWPRSSYLNYFKEPYIPPLRKELHVEEITYLEEINEDLVIEEDPKIKIIVEENNEDPIIEKDLEVEMIETIEEEIEEESFKDLNEIKSYVCQSQDPFILVVSDTLKFIDFIGVDRFDSIVRSYLVNLHYYMKTKEKEIQVNFFIPLISYKYGKKIKGLRHSKYLFIWSERFYISKINLCNLLFLVFLCNFRYFRLGTFISLFLGVFNAF